MVPYCERACRSSSRFITNRRLLVSDSIITGAALLVAAGFGVVLTHIRVKDSLKDTLPIATLGILAIILLSIITG